MGKYLSEAATAEGPKPRASMRRTGGKADKGRQEPFQGANRSAKRRGSGDDDDSSRKTIFAAMGANLGIAVTKIGAAIFTGSSSMLAEGIHSIIDTLNQVLLLVGLKHAKRPPDEDHPFGHGSEIYFWAFMVAIFLFALGAGVSIVEGIYKLLAGEEGGLSSPWIALVVLFIAFCFEGYSWSVAYREFNQRRKGDGFIQDFKRLKDPSIFVVLFEDTAACTGILAAALGVGLSWATGIHAFDAIGSIVVGVILGVTSILLAIEVKGLLIGETADPDVERDIQKHVSARDEILAINEFRSLHLGPNDVLLTMSVDFRDDVRAGRIEEIVTEIEAEVKDRYDFVRTVFVEVQSRSGHERFAESDAEPGALS